MSKDDPDDLLKRMGLPAACPAVAACRLWLSEQHWPHLASKIRDVMGAIHVSSDTHGNIWVCREKDPYYGYWLDDEDLIELVRRLRDARYENMRPIK